jgi:hypothetical protein
MVEAGGVELPCFSLKSSGFCYNPATSFQGGKFFSIFFEKRLEIYPALGYKKDRDREKGSLKKKGDGAMESNYKLYKPGDDRNYGEFETMQEAVEAAEAMNDEDVCIAHVDPETKIAWQYDCHGELIGDAGTMD